MLCCKNGTTININGIKTPKHPLFPLSKEEIIQATTLIHGSNIITCPPNESIKSNVRIISITLQEPPKALFLSGLKNGELTVDREAKAVVFCNRNSTAYELLLNLTQGNNIIEELHKTTVHKLILTTTFSYQ